MLGGDTGVSLGAAGGPQNPPGALSGLEGTPNPSWGHTGGPQKPPQDPNPPPQDTQGDPNLPLGTLKPPLGPCLGTWGPQNPLSPHLDMGGTPKSLLGPIWAYRGTPKLHSGHQKHPQAPSGHIGGPQNFYWDPKTPFGTHLGTPKPPGTPSGHEGDPKTPFGPHLGVQVDS